MKWMAKLDNNLFVILYVAFFSLNNKKNVHNVHKDFI